MKRNFYRRISLLGTRRFLDVGVSLIVFAAISGCVSNGVSVLTRQSPGRAIKPAEVKVYSDFKNVGVPWRLEGMISANILPLMSNTPENREELMKSTAADLGLNMVVGVQSSVNGDGLLGHSNAILASTGTASEKGDSLPKFIVFVPAVNFKIQKDPSMDELDKYIRNYIRYFLTYSKGYYIYQYDLPGIAPNDLLQGKIDPATFIEPLGIAPDYALLCDVTGYDETGNVIVNRVRQLKLTMTLFDLKEMKNVWVSETSGNSKQSYLLNVLNPFDGGLLGGLNGILTHKEETLKMIRRAIRDAIDSLPEVAGFRPGPLNFMRGQLDE